MNATISQLIEEHIGHEVRVFYLGEINTNDKGVLTRQDGVCIHLERRGETDLLIPISSIRMMTVPSTKGEPVRSLPRPAGGPNDHDPA